MFSKITYTVILFSISFEKLRQMFLFISRCSGTSTFHIGNSFFKFNPCTEEIKLCSLSCIYNIIFAYGQSPKPPDLGLKLGTIFEHGPALTGGLD